MLVIAAGDTLAGVAGTATAITITATGVSVDATTGAETLGKLYQGQLPNAAATLFTVAAGKSYVIKTLTLTNSSGSPVTGISLFVSGSAASNSILGGITLASGATATFGENGWQVSDTNGQTLVASITGGITQLTGDVTAGPGSGSQSASVVRVNGAVVPTSAKAVASNASNQLIAATLAGTGAGLTTGPTTSVSGDVVTFTGVVGQVADSGTLLTALAPKASPTFTGSVTLPLSTGGLVTTTAGGVIGSEATATIGQGGTGTGSTLTGLVRGGASAMTAAELSGDVTTSGSNVATVVKVNGGAVPPSAVVLGSNASSQPVAATTTGSGTTVVLADSPSFVNRTTNGSGGFFTNTNTSGTVAYGLNAAGASYLGIGPTLAGTGVSAIAFGHSTAPNGTLIIDMIVGENGNVGINTITPHSKFAVVGLPVYANNAAAITGGLAAGDFYRDGSDPDHVCVVH